MAARKMVEKKTVEKKMNPIFFSPNLLFASIDAPADISGSRWKIFSRFLLPWGDGKCIHKVGR